MLLGKDGWLRSPSAMGFLGLPRSVKRLNYNAVPMAERPSPVLDYGAFQQPPSPLFRDYLSRSERVLPFYDGARWDLEGVLAAAERAASAQGPRELVSRALAAQQEGRGASRAAARALSLADPRAVAVVTGQQSVLFG